MHPALRIARQVVGWLLLVVGLVGLLIPIFPSIPFFAAGALLLAPYVRVFRRLAAWMHKRYPRFRGPLRHFRDFKRPRPPAADDPPTLTGN